MTQNEALSLLAAAALARTRGLPGHGERAAACARAALSEALRAAARPSDRPVALSGSGGSVCAALDGDRLRISVSFVVGLGQAPEAGPEAALAQQEVLDAVAAELDIFAPLKEAGKPMSVKTFMALDRTGVKAQVDLDFSAGRIMELAGVQSNGGQKPAAC